MKVVVLVRIDSTKGPMLAVSNGDDALVTRVSLESATALFPLVFAKIPDDEWTSVIEADFDNDDVSCARIISDNVPFTEDIN